MTEPDSDSLIKGLEESIARLEKELDAIRLHHQGLKKHSRRKVDTFEMWAKRQRTRNGILAEVTSFSIALAFFMSFLVAGSYVGFHVDYFRQFWIRLAPGVWDDVIKVGIFWGLVLFNFIILKRARGRDSL